MVMTEPSSLAAPIVRVVRHYYPDWEPPEDRGQAWIKCLCPFHAESRPSASVSYTKGAIACHGCGRKGDVISLIRTEERLAYGAAVARAKEILGRSYQPVPRGTSRKPGRRAFGEPRTPRAERQGRDREVPPWLRR
ncbi:CHC2 zinc finger domain-containing protein [Actinocrispum wychmicini]|uniref:CHC2 zinc finger domain-containing protein n=1 Tax=Actinocrispum wychmicini TaxID=1213861 RepID=UPI003C7B76E0